MPEGSGTGYALGAEHEIYASAVQAASDRTDLVLSGTHQLAAATAAGCRGPPVPGEAERRWPAAGDDNQVGVGATRAIRGTPNAPAMGGNDHRHELRAHVETAGPAVRGNGVHREAGRLARLIEVLRGRNAERHAATGAGQRCRTSMALPCGPVLRAHRMRARRRRRGTARRVLGDVRAAGARCSCAGRRRGLTRC